jgi:hypothetical protein
MFESNFHGRHLRTTHVIADAITSSITDHVSSLESSFRYLTPIVTTMIPLYMLLTIIRSIRSRTTGNLSSFPYSALMINSFGGVLYGIMKDDSVIVYPAIIGLIVSAVCLISCYCYGSYRHQLAREVMIITISSIFATWMFLQAQIHTFGMYCSITSLLLVASPLAVLQNAFDNVGSTISAKVTVPYYMTVLMWTYSLIWMAHGAVVVHDPLMYGPHILGLMISTFGLLVCCILSAIQKQH